MVLEHDHFLKLIVARWAFHGLLEDLKSQVPLAFLSWLAEEAFLFLFLCGLLVPDLSLGGRGETARPVVATLVLRALLCAGLVACAIGTALCASTLDLFHCEVTEVEAKLLLAILDTRAVH